MPSNYFSQLPQLARPLKPLRTFEAILMPQDERSLQSDAIWREQQALRAAKTRASLASQKYGVFPVVPANFASLQFSTKPQTIPPQVQAAREYSNRMIATHGFLPEITDAVQTVYPETQQKFRGNPTGGVGEMTYPSNAEIEDFVRGEKIETSNIEGIPHMGIPNRKTWEDLANDPRFHALAIKNPALADQFAKEHTGMSVKELGLRAAQIRAAKMQQREFEGKLVEEDIKAFREQLRKGEIIPPHQSDSGDWEILDPLIKRPRPATRAQKAQIMQMLQTQTNAQQDIASLQILSSGQDSEQISDQAAEFVKAAQRKEKADYIDAFVRGTADVASTGIVPNSILQKTLANAIEEGVPVEQAIQEVRSLIYKIQERQQRAQE